MTRLLLATIVSFVLLVGAANAWKPGAHRAYKACERGRVTACIRRSAIRFDQSYVALRSVAYCESRLSPRAYNHQSGTSGLFQFMPSTWYTTPYRHHSIWSAKFSALAAGWMWRKGRRGEWSC